MERALKRKTEELPVSTEYCPKWIFTATEGAISSEKWAYGWSQVGFCYSIKYDRITRFLT